MTRWGDESARVPIWQRYFIDIIYRCQAQPIWSERKGFLARKREREKARMREREKERARDNERIKKKETNKYLSAGCRPRMMRSASGCCRWMNQGQVKNLPRRERDDSGCKYAWYKRACGFYPREWEIKIQKERKRTTIRWTIIVSNQRNERKKTWESATATPSKVDGRISHIYTSEGEWEQETQGEFP